MSAGDKVETELKLGLVDALQLPLLLTVMPAPRLLVEQVNSYMTDLDHTLQRAAIMLRVRVERMWTGAAARDRFEAGQPPIDTLVTVTAKRRLSIEAGVFVAQEFEQTMALGAWRAIEIGDKQLLNLPGAATAFVKAQVGELAVFRQGMMTNLRHIIDAPGGLVLEVDRTRFPDGSIDAEVEVETDDLARAREVVQAYAQEAGVTLFEQTKGKYRRFCERGTPS